MKTEDYEKLKQLCDANGFELLTESPKENEKYFVVKKKDIWKGVEFAECVDEYLLTGAINLGRIYPIRIFKDDCIGSTAFTGIIHKSKFKPSTESAYIEQLKRIAF